MDLLVEEPEPVVVQLLLVEHHNTALALVRHPTDLQLVQVDCTARQVVVPEPSAHPTDLPRSVEVPLHRQKSGLDMQAEPVQQRIEEQVLRTFGLHRRQAVSDSLAAHHRHHPGQEEPKVQE